MPSKQGISMRSIIIHNKKKRMHVPLAVQVVTRVGTDL